MEKKKTPLFKQKGFHLFLMNLPFLVLVFILSYLPLRGWVNAFYNYKPGIPLSQSTFVGLKYFTMMFKDRLAVREVGRVMANTLGINLISYCFSPLAMFFAMFLTEMRGKWFKKFVQTATTLPNFISWVTVYAIAFSLFSVSDGLVNHLLLNLGIVNEPINFLTQTGGLWLKMVLWGVWKGTGWSAILYFAAISGIDQEMYEAAMIDGAGRFRMMWYITLPHLIPTFFVLLILSIGNFLNTGMEQYLLFSNPMTANRLEVLDLYVYNQGLVKVQFAYTTAVGMLKSIIGVILLFGANQLSKLIRGYGIL